MEKLRREEWRGRGLPPVERVTARMGNVVGYECDKQHDAGSSQTGDEGVPVAQLPYAFSSGNGDESRGPSGRVQRAGSQHDGYGCGYGKACGKPCGFGEKESHGNSRERGDEVAAYQIAGLGQRALYGSEGKHGRGTEGTDKQGKACASGNVAFQQGDEGNGNAASQPGDEYFLSAGAWRCFSSPAHFFEYLRHMFSSWKIIRPGKNIEEREGEDCVCRHRHEGIFQA